MGVTVGLWQLEVKGNFSNTDQTRNIFYFTTTAVVPPGTVATLDWIQSLWSPTLLGRLSSQWHLTGYVWRVWIAPHWTFSYEVNNLTIAGTAGGDLLPQQMSAVVVGICSGRVRPKKFIAGVLETDNNQGVVSGALVTELAGFGLAWITTLTDGANLYNAVAVNRTKTSSLLLNTARVDTIFGTQRRRKQGVGA